MHACVWVWVCCCSSKLRWADHEFVVLELCPFYVQWKQVPPSEAQVQSSKLYAEADALLKSGNVVAAAEKTCLALRFDPVVHSNSNNGHGGSARNGLRSVTEARGTRNGPYSSTLSSLHSAADLAPPCPATGADATMHMANTLVGCRPQTSSATGDGCDVLGEAPTARPRPRDYLRVFDFDARSYDDKRRGISHTNYNSGDGDGLLATRPAQPVDGSRRVNSCSPPPASMEQVWV